MDKRASYNPFGTQRSQCKGKRQAEIEYLHIVLGPKMGKWEGVVLQGETC